MVRELALLGHRSLPVVLPGHGLDAPLPMSYQTQDLAAFSAAPSPMSAITVEDNVSHVIDVVQRVHRRGPVILVAGHARVVHQARELAAPVTGIETPGRCGRRRRRGADARSTAAADRTRRQGTLGRATGDSCMPTKAVSQWVSICAIFMSSS